MGFEFPIAPRSGAARGFEKGAAQRVTAREFHRKGLGLYIFLPTVQAGSAINDNGLELKRRQTESRHKDSEAKFLW